MWHCGHESSRPGGIAAMWHCGHESSRPGGIAAMWHCDLAASRPGGIAAMWHCGHESSRPCGIAAMSHRGQVALRPCGIATWRHRDLVALRVLRITVSYLHCRSLPVIRIADTRHHPAPCWRHSRRVQPALRPDGIATWRHCDLVALRPCDRRLGLRTGPVAVRSCRRHGIGLAGCRHCGVAAVRKSGQRLFASPDSRCPCEEQS
jgi:hypothetical protein